MMFDLVSHADKNARMARYGIKIPKRGIQIEIRSYEGPPAMLAGLVLWHLYD